MIELRGIRDLEGHNLKIEALPVEVQEQIQQTLTILDESYGEVGERTFEGGKVIVVEEKEDAKHVNTLYGLKNNEFADEIYTVDGV